MRCRPHRFKEDWGFQKCKPCLDCALLSRFQKANCSATSDAVCGDCLPGYVASASRVTRSLLGKGISLVPFQRHLPALT